MRYQWFSERASLGADGRVQTKSIGYNCSANILSQALNHWADPVTEPVIMHTTRSRGDASAGDYLNRYQRNAAATQPLNRVETICLACDYLANLADPMAPDRTSILLASEAARAFRDKSQTRRQA